MTEFINTTKDERKKMIQGYQYEIQEQKDDISTLEDEIKDVEKQSRALYEDNEVKLFRRSKVNKKIKSIKAKSTLLILLGLIMLGVCAYLLIQSKTFFGICAALVGVASIVYGFVYRPKWKQFAQEQYDAHKALEEYDKIQEGHARSISDKKAQIKKHQLEIQSVESKIQAIKDFEKYEPYYRWVEKSETGHIVVMVTGDTNFSDSAPQPAKEGKKYSRTGSFVDSIEVYLNEMLYCRATPKGLKNQNGGFGIIEIEEEGTNKLQVCINMSVGNNSFQRIGDPIPVKKSNRSTFVWYHASLCSKGTSVFMTTYDNFEDFRKATSLTMDDVLKYI